MSSMCRARAASARRVSDSVTEPVKPATSSGMRADPVAVGPSTARNALAMAALILLGSHSDSVPERLMTRRATTASGVDTGAGEPRATAAARAAGIRLLLVPGPGQEDAAT